MKTNGKHWVGILSAMALLCGAVLADDEGDESTGRGPSGERGNRPRLGREEIREKMMQYDADGDGELSETERETARTAIREEMITKRLDTFFAEHDSNGDGCISKDEVRSAWDARRAKMGDRKPGEGRKWRSRPPRDRGNGNNGVGNGPDDQPPGNPPINDGPGTAPGNPGAQPDNV